MPAIDVYGEVSDKLVEGMMLHSDHADLFDFLGLKGFKRLHEYGYLHDTGNYRMIHRYAINHLGMIPPQGRQERPTSLDAYMGRDRMDVAEGERRESVEGSITAWVMWERETKAAYQRAWETLTRIGEVAAARPIEKLIKDVDRELKKAERLHIRIKATGYDMGHIMEMQGDMHDKYREKIRCVGERIC